MQAQGNTLLHFLQRPPPPIHLPPPPALQLHNACDFPETHFPSKSASYTLDAAASRMAFLRLMSLEGSSCCSAAANYPLIQDHAHDRGMLINAHTIISCSPTLHHDDELGELPSRADCLYAGNADDHMHPNAAAGERKGADPNFEFGRYGHGERELPSDGAPPPACCTAAEDRGARIPAAEMPHASRSSPCSMITSDNIAQQQRSQVPYIPCTAAAQLDVDQGSNISCNSSYNYRPNDHDNLVISTPPSFGSIQLMGACSVTDAAAPSATAVVDADAHTSCCIRPAASGGPAPPPKKKRKRSRSSASRKRNREEVESQRMTHIAVERNRRRQMNEHLGVLRTLMPPSYIQRGDQASIIGGAIEFVRELEHILQSLQVQKQRETYASLPLRANFWDDRTLRQQVNIHPSQTDENCFQPIKETYAESNSLVANVQVKMDGSFALVKVLTQRRPRQLLQTISFIESLHLKIMHVNISTIEDTKLYSFNLQMGSYECETYSACELASTFQNVFTMSMNEASEVRD